MMQNFNFHSHTFRCGHATPDYLDEDYVRDYIEAGFQSMAFTDHAPNRLHDDPKIRMKHEMLPDYLQSVYALREKYRDQLRIYTGLEVEYTRKTEDELRAWREELDILVLGQHLFLRDDGTVRTFGTAFDRDDLLAYASHIRTACEKQLADLIAHPDIIMLWQKRFGKEEEKAAHLICEAACQTGVPIEINLNNIFRHTFHENWTLNDEPLAKQEKKLSSVVYPCTDFWKIAASYGVKAVYGLDAHYRGQIARFSDLVALAQTLLTDDVLARLTFVTEEEIVKKRFLKKSI